jgi:hypothetical protein
MAKDRSKTSVPAQEVWRIRGFSLGGEQAEADGLLDDAFVESGPYSAITSRDDPRCFLVGRTGSGKSAILHRLKDINPDHVIRIDPEELSLQYITDLNVIRYLSELDVHLDPFFIALWKHVLLIEIIKHRYKVESQDVLERFFASLMDRVRRDRSKQAALEYLHEFEGRFWRETDERIKEITREFENQIQAEAGGRLLTPAGTASGKTSARTTESQAERKELISRFQRVVNDTQLPKLNRMINVLGEDILDEQHFTYVIIDDLDREWIDEKVANDLIRCLFRAVVDLKRVRHLKVLVALRTNIVERLDYGRSGGQQEKVRALTMRVRWTREDLEELLDQRARIAAARHGASHVTGIADLLPPVDATRGDALAQILGKTLLRPRDAITFLNECLEEASGRQRIDWDVVQSAEASYSNNRLLALRDEWKPTYSDIDKVFHIFEEAPARLSPEELGRLLSKCVDLVKDQSFDGRRWLAQLVPTSRAARSDPSAYKGLVQILYNIGFLGYSFGRGNPDIYSHDESDALDKANSFRQVSTFVVHPAFRRALDMQAGTVRAPANTQLPTPLRGRGPRGRAKSRS